MSRLGCLVCGLILLGSGTAALADPPPGIRYTTLDATPVSDAELADYWRIDTEDAARYRRYMALEGRYYYAHLDPVMVLGLIETDPDRRRRFAEQYLLAERRRVTQQTGFAALVAQAQQHLYGHEPLFDFATLPQAAHSPGYRQARAERLGEPPAQGAMSRPVERGPSAMPTGTDFQPRAGDTLDLLVAPDCRTACYRLLTELLETPAAVVSVYGYRFADVDALVAWLEAGLAVPLDDPAIAGRLQLKRFDPLVFADVRPLSAPLALLRRDGVVVGARR